MSLRRPLEDESLVDESLVKKRKALSTVVVVPDDSQSLVVLESHVEAQAPAAQAEEISKEEYQRVKNTILGGDVPAQAPAEGGVAPVALGGDVPVVAGGDVPGPVAVGGDYWTWADTLRHRLIIPATVPAPAHVPLPFPAVRLRPEPLDDASVQARREARQRTLWEGDTTDEARTSEEEADALRQLEEADEAALLQRLREERRARGVHREDTLAYAQLLAQYAPDLLSPPSSPQRRRSRTPPRPL